MIIIIIIIIIHSFIMRAYPGIHTSLEAATAINSSSQEMGLGQIVQISYPGIAFMMQKICFSMDHCQPGVSNPIL